MADFCDSPLSAHLDLNFRATVSGMSLNKMFFIIYYSKKDYLIVKVFSEIFKKSVKNFNAEKSNHFLRINRV